MQLRIPGPGEDVASEYSRRLDRLDRMVVQLDCRFRLPWTNVRFGWDPLVGIVPVAGDIVMAAIALNIVAQARDLGADRKIITRMLMNVGVDTLIGAIPVVGPLFDLWFKANLRNLTLLTDEIRRQRSAEQDRPT